MYLYIHHNIHIQYSIHNPCRKTHGITRLRAVKGILSQIHVVQCSLKGTVPEASLKSKASQSNG
jgi:hypothetical protein